MASIVGRFREGGDKIIFKKGIKKEFNWSGQDELWGFMENN